MKTLRILVLIASAFAGNAPGLALDQEGLVPHVDDRGSVRLPPGTKIDRDAEGRFPSRPAAGEIPGAGVTPDDVGSDKLNALAAEPFKQIGRSRPRSVDQLLSKRIQLYQYVEADGIVLQDGAIAAGSRTLAVGSASFKAADIGKVVLVKGAAANGAILQTTITARTDATTVTIGIAATRAVSNVEVTYGTDDTAGVQAAFDAAKSLGGATVQAPFGTILMSGTATIDLSKFKATRYIGSITGVNLVGQGPGSTKFRWIGTGNAPMFAVLGGTDGFAASRQMRWGGYATNTARSGQGGGHLFSIAADLEFFDTYAAELDLAYHLIDVLTTRFFNVEMNYGRRGLWAYRGTFSGPNAISFFGGGIDHMNEWGAVIEQGADINLFGTNLQGNGFDGTAPERGGIRVINPGLEGGVAININGGYNEAQGGQGVLWVTTGPNKPVTVNVLGFTSNQGAVDIRKESLNSIRIDADSTGPVLLNIAGSAWRSFEKYPASSARNRIATTGPVRIVGEALFQNPVEAPFLGGSGTVAASGAPGSLPMGVAVSKVATGVYRLKHNAGSADAYFASAIVNDLGMALVIGLAKSANHVDVRIVDPRFSPVDAGFDFILRRN